MNNTKKLRRTIITGMLVITGGAASMANAEVVGSVGYGSLSDDDIRLGTLQGTVGYKIDTGSNLSFIPEVRFGVGVGDDTDPVFGSKVEVDKFYGVNLRAQWEGDQTYFFVAPSYTNVELEATLAGVTASADEWEFGGGFGAGWKFSDNAALEASYEYFDGTDVLGVGLRFEF